MSPPDFLFPKPLSQSLEFPLSCLIITADSASVGEPAPIGLEEELGFRIALVAVIALSFRGANGARSMVGPFQNPRALLIQKADMLLVRLETLVDVLTPCLTEQKQSCRFLSCQQFLPMRQ